MDFNKIVGEHTYSLPGKQRGWHPHPTTPPVLSQRNLVKMRTWSEQTATVTVSQGQVGVYADPTYIESAVIYTQMTLCTRGGCMDRLAFREETSQYEDLTDTGN